MRRFRLSPPAYRAVTLVAAVLLGVIIITGAAVRLTGSGLGCPDWPNCEPGSLVPKGADNEHAMVEFVNRVFTGAVSLAVIICVLGSLLRTPRRRDLIWLSLGLVAGVFAQAVVGGLTVLFELRPEFVMTHFMLSLVLLTNAVVLFRRAGAPDTPPRAVVPAHVVALGRTLLGSLSVVVFTGTIVTATGPHGGDEEARRFGFDIGTVARIHGSSVVLFVTLVLVTLAVVRRADAPHGVESRLGAVLLIALVQAAIGYIQYLNDIPVVLVGMHIAGATSLWTATVWFHLGLFTREPAGVAAPPGRDRAGAEELLPA